MRVHPGNPPGAGGGQQGEPSVTGPPGHGCPGISYKTSTSRDQPVRRRRPGLQRACVRSRPCQLLPGKMRVLPLVRGPCLWFAAAAGPKWQSPAVPKQTPFCLFRLMFTWYQDWHPEKTPHPPSALGLVSPQAGTGPTELGALSPALEFGGGAPPRS